jgi:hypothetical protein
MEPVMSQGACIDFPASGNRNNTTGALNNLGVNGYAWSSSASAANGHNLNLTGATVTPANTNNRANGFPVRCVKNLTEMPVYILPENRKLSGRIFIKYIFVCIIVYI